MTIYILTWIDSDADFPSQRFAATTNKEVKQKYLELSKTKDIDITLTDEESAIKKIKIKTQKDIVDLINTLL